MNIKKILTVLALSALLTAPLCGCFSDQTPALSPENVTKLTAVLDEKPAAIPEKGWDEESIAKVIKYGGKAVGFPCTLNDLGAEFDYAEDGRFTVSDDGDVYGDLIFDTCNIGTAKLVDAPSKDEYRKGTVKLLQFTAGKYGDGKFWPSVYPISINGVTIGSSAKDIEEKLGFKSKGINQINVVAEIGCYRIVFAGTKLDGVTSIAISNTKLQF